MEKLTYLSTAKKVLNKLEIDPTVCTSWIKLSVQNVTEIHFENHNFAFAYSETCSNIPNIGCALLMQLLSRHMSSINLQYSTNRHETYS